MRMKSLIPIVVLIAVLSIFMSYVPAVLSENDDQLNVSGTGYEQAHDSNVRIQTATFSLLGPVAMILGAIALIFTMLSLKRGNGRR